MARVAGSILVAVLLSTGACAWAAAAQKLPQQPKPDPVTLLDDVKKWPTRDFANATAISCPACVYIKDADAKNNKEADTLEGADFLGSEDLRVKLRAFTRIKIKNDGSNSKGWPAAWLKAADSGAVLILFSSDKSKVFPFGKATPKKDFSKEGLLSAIDTLLKYEAERKALAEAKQKELAAKNPQPEEKPVVPGMDPTKKPSAEPKPKPKETPPENE